IESVRMPTREVRERLRDLLGEGQTTSSDAGFSNPRIYLTLESTPDCILGMGATNGEPRGQNRPSRPGDGHQHRHDPFLREAGIVEAIAAYRRRIPPIRPERYRNSKIRTQASRTGVFTA